MPKVLLFCRLMSIRTRNRLDANVPILLYRCAVQQLQMVMASLNRLVNRSIPIYCRSHRLASSKQMVKIVSTWFKWIKFANLENILLKNFIFFAIHTEYLMNVVWSIELVDCRECHTIHMSYLRDQKPINDQMDQHKRQQLVNLDVSQALLLVLPYLRIHVFLNPRNVQFYPKSIRNSLI